jgi:aminomethyltransferase
MRRSCAVAEIRGGDTPREIRFDPTKAWKLDKKTALYDEHLKAGARIVPFAGFSMPIQYSGIIEEHRAVRQAAGLFDLSHMGEFRLSGEGALDAVDRLVTNDVRGLEPYQVRYTPMCFPNGGIVDDILVYRFPDHLMLVVNASNIEKDLEWVTSEAPPSVRVEDISDAVALIAVQGPASETVLRELTAVDLRAIGYYHFTEGKVDGVSATISRTGYTGEDGFELYVAPEDAQSLWRALLARGADHGLKPVGLGARDTLRLEAGYMLYGNDIDDSTTPLEAGLGWTVKFGEHDFIGRPVLEHQKAEGVPRRMIQIEMLDRGIPRPHQPILQNDEQIGELTSGTFSPTFSKGVALGYARTGAAKVGSEVQIEIRGERHPARVARKPMYKRED